MYGGGSFAPEAPLARWGGWPIVVARRSEAWRVAFVLMETVGDASLELGLTDYLAILRRRALLIILTTLVIAGVAVAVSQQQPKAYQTTATVLLSPSSSTVFSSTANIDTGSLNVTNDKSGLNISTEVGLFSTDAFNAQAAKVIGFEPDNTPVVSQIPLTLLLNITAKEPNGQRAADVANGFAKTYIDLKQAAVSSDRSSATKSIQDSAAGIQAQIAAIDAEVAKFPAGPEQDAATVRFAPQKSGLQARLNTLQSKLDQLGIDAALAGPVASIVSPATVPINSISPLSAKKVGAIGLLIGLVVALALALIVDFLDGTVKDRVDLARAAGGLPVLAIIPKRRNSIRKDPLPARRSPQSAVAEAFRTLRTSVLFAGFDRPLHTVEIVGPGTKDGQSMVGANLAVTIAAAGQRTVAVSGNLRNPSMHTILGVDNTTGLSSVLSGTAQLDSAVRDVPGVENLRALPSGPLPPNPAELLASPGMKDVMDDLGQRSEVIVVDSAAAGRVTDATIIAPLSDATLIVVNERVTLKSELAQAIEKLRFVDAPLLGIVLISKSKRRRG